MIDRTSKLKNPKIKTLTIFGTRPEAVKLAPVVQELKRAEAIRSFVCVTAQHREMLDQVLNLFNIQPDIDLNLMREDQSLAVLSAAIFTHLDSVMEKYQPDWILLQGDTTTAAIASLLAYYRRIRVGHIEAGLRTHDKWQPFPEEINRRMVGVIADLHFAPTEWARQNLLQEGVPDKSIVVSGNPVIDALYSVVALPEPKEIEELLTRINVAHGERKLVLVTAHRRENFGTPLENICNALKEIANRGDLEIVYPVHLNPNVQKTVYRFLRNVEHITLISPLDYLSIAHLIRRSAMILTDSGGIQEEAPAFGVPVLVLREITERPEGIEAGVLKLVGTNRKLIVREANRLLDDKEAYASMARAVNPFGDGHAAGRIVQALVNSV